MAFRAELPPLSPQLGGFGRPWSGTDGERTAAYEAARSREGQRSARGRSGHGWTGADGEKEGRCHERQQAGSGWRPGRSAAARRETRRILFGRRVGRPSKYRPDHHLRDLVAYFRAAHDAIEEPERVKSGSVRWIQRPVRSPSLARGLEKLEDVQAMADARGAKRGADRRSAVRKPPIF